MVLSMGLFSFVRFHLVSMLIGANGKKAGAILTAANYMVFWDNSLCQKACRSRAMLL